MDADGERVERWSTPLRAATPSWSLLPEPRAAAALSLAEVWQELVTGKLQVVASGYENEQCVARLRRTARPVPLKPLRAKTLQRVLLGESPKVIAFERGVAVSSVTGACSDSLSATGAGRWTSRAPMWFAMAAHASAGFRVPDATQESIGEAIALRMPRPDLSLRGRLTRAENSVARLYLEGDSHVSISRQCQSAPRTVANQLASVFRKLGISGRADLLSRLIREQWPE